MSEILIVGGGIGGLTLALELHRRGIACRVFESAPEVKALGVGVNLLPHAMRVYTDLGLQEAIAKVAVETSEAAFFNRYGQLIYREPLGKRAGYPWPQFSIHRGDLHLILLGAVKERIGAERLHLGFHCTGFSQDDKEVFLQFRERAHIKGAAAIACDGIHSVIRKQLYPNEGEPRYSGVNMWRGVTRWKPMLSGASMVRAGWLSHGKMVIYPIRDAIDADGNQLVNWVAEIEAEQPAVRDWSREGRLEDFLPAFENWHFDWLDVPALIRGADSILEYPMVDQDPLPRWTHGRITLLGDAAHPMVPRGSNGAGQAIIDARCLAGRLKKEGVGPAALESYDQERVPATANVVLTNRRTPPDAILREVYERSGGKPFARIDDVVPRAELQAISDAYKRVAGYDPAQLKNRPSFL